METPVSKRAWHTTFRTVVKWAIFLVVLIFIVRRGVELWKTAPAEAISVNGLWLVPAALSYFVGWLPSVWLWRRFLFAMGQPISWWTALRAYYVGHLGKYVPGKALALVIRGALVKDDDVSPLLAGVTGACETIVYMAAGGAVAVMLSPIALGRSPAIELLASSVWIQEHPSLWILIVALGTFATTPLSAWFFTRICRQATGRSGTAEGRIPARRHEDGQKPEGKTTEARISASLVSQGVIVTACGWLFHGLSLGFVLQSISSRPIDFSQFPMWLAACSLSMVGGFIVLVAPGGIGVREGLLIEALKDQPSVGPAAAIIAAGILRALWFATELIVAGGLFGAGRNRPLAPKPPTVDVNGSPPESPGS